MFKSNDKSFFIIRKVVNVVYFVLMCIAVIAGIILISTSSYTYTNYNKTYSAIDWIQLVIGLSVMLLGPVVLQFGWVITDAIFNMVLDVKIIRSATCGSDLPKLPAPLFHNKVKNNESTMDVYEKLKMYKVLCDEGILSATEYEDIKRSLLKDKVSENANFESDIEKVRKLKTYADEQILTNEEFVAEKSKILKK